MPVCSNLRKSSTQYSNEQNTVLVGSLVLEMLCTSQTLELSIHHDGQSCTQSLTLLHTVYRTGQQRLRETYKSECVHYSHTPHL